MAGLRRLDLRGRLAADDRDELRPEVLGNDAGVRPQLLQELVRGPDLVGDAERREARLFGLDLRVALLRMHARRRGGQEAPHALRFPARVPVPQELVREGGEHALLECRVAFAGRHLAGAVQPLGQCVDAELRLALRAVQACPCHAGLLVVERARHLLEPVRVQVVEGGRLGPVRSGDQHAEPVEARSCDNAVPLVPRRPGSVRALRRGRQAQLGRMHRAGGGRRKPIPPALSGVAGRMVAGFVVARQRSALSKLIGAWLQNVPAPCFQSVKP